MDNGLNLDELAAAWPDDQKDLWAVFRELTEAAQSLPGARLSLVSRPGVSHSLRAALDRPSSPRPVFFLVDVVVSEADPWFLSVCFYEDEITDPDELGNAIPQGLFEETGYCFDVEELEPDLNAYLKQRLAEAHQRAGLA